MIVTNNHVKVVPLLRITDGQSFKIKILKKVLPWFYDCKLTKTKHWVHMRVYLTLELCNNEALRMHMQAAESHGQQND